jgi:serine/threonine-protein kinase
VNCADCKGELEDDALFCGYCGKRTRTRRDSVIGTLIDNAYRIDEKIAHGGFGAIYRATHVASGATLALKVLHADFADDPALAGRFLRESKALAKLKNPHTVVTYERGEAPDGTLYIAMELLRGESLLDRFKRKGPLHWRDVLAIMRAVCSSLAEAHAHGIVHRDLKPANIFLAGENDFVKVLDFGVAKVLPWSNLDDGSEFTLAGQAVGTLEYMAPEQLAGAGDCDARTDIYALGVVAFEMLTGRRPFAEASTAAAMITALYTQPAPVPSMVRAVPGPVDQLILRCLEREVGDRYANVAELVGAIDRILSRPTPKAGDSQLAPLAVGHGPTPQRHVALAPMHAFVVRPAASTASLPELDFAPRGSVINVLPVIEPKPPVVATVSTRPSRLWPLVAGAIALATAGIGLGYLISGG